MISMSPTVTLTDLNWIMPAQGNDVCILKFADTAPKQGGFFV